MKSGWLNTPAKLISAFLQLLISKNLHFENVRRNLMIGIDVEMANKCLPSFFSSFLFFLLVSRFFFSFLRLVLIRLIAVTIRDSVLPFTAENAFR